MKLGTLILPLLLIFSIFLAGCSEEKGDDSNKKMVVKKTITKLPEEKKTEKVPFTENSIPAPQKQKTEDAKKSVKEEERFYDAKGEESLSMIAARKDVYGDPLKWILLYRFNRDSFDQIEKDRSFPDKYIRADTRLKFSTVDTGKMTKTGANEHWVVNVLSSPEGEKITPYAIRLIDNGYPVYITKANVKGQDYIRLRVGFYDERVAAEDVGQKIASILNVSDIWTTRADKSEFKEYSGYK